MRQTLLCASLLLLAAPLFQAAENTPSAGGTGSQKQSARPTEAGGSSQKKPAEKPVQEASKPSGEQPKDSSKEASKTKKTSKDSKEKSASADRPPATEDERFSAARTAASEDKVVADLRNKADTAKSQEAATRAMRAYMRGLYSKMRSIEPSLQERINMTEAAALRALPQTAQTQ
jgi:hypothetical protein